MVIALASYIISEASREYEARAILLQDESAADGVASAYVEAYAVLAEAAALVPGETAASLEEAVQASVDPASGLLVVDATDVDADTAAEIANAVANTFLGVRGGVLAERLQEQGEELRRQLRDEAGTAEFRSALRARIAELNAREVRITSDLMLLQPAVPPLSKNSSRAWRNALIAFAAALIGLSLLVLLRTLVRKPPEGGWQVGDLIGAPIVGEIPWTPRRWGVHRDRAALAERDSFRALRDQLSRRLNGDQPRVVVVTSAGPAQGKTTVTANLGRALAERGRSVLLVDGDTRVPALHTAFELPSETDDARQLLQGGELPGARSLETGVEGAGELALIPGGKPAPDGGSALSLSSVSRAFDLLRTAANDVLVDGPPVLDRLDGQVLAECADAVLVVCRPDRSRVEELRALRVTMERLGVAPAGVVLVG